MGFMAQISVYCSPNPNCIIYSNGSNNYEDFSIRIEEYTNVIKHSDNKDIEEIIDNLLDMIDAVEKEGFLIYRRDYYYNEAVNKVLQSCPNVPAEILQKIINMIRARDDQRNQMRRHKWSKLTDTKMNTNVPIYCDSNNIPPRLMGNIGKIIAGVICVALPIPIPEIKKAGLLLIAESVYEAGMIVYETYQEKEKRIAERLKPFEEDNSREERQRKRRMNCAVYGND